MIKTCTICKEEKEYEEFFNDKTHSDGKQSRCKVCIKEYRNQNKDWINEIQRKSRNKRKDKVNKLKRDLYWKNPERHRASCKRWSIENRQWKIDYDRKYYKKNRKSLLESKKEQILSEDVIRKRLIRGRTNSAIRRGKIERQDCAYQGGQCDGRLEAHHWDYSKEMEVVWFCTKHHRMADRVKKILEKENRKFDYALI